MNSYVGRTDMKIYQILQEGVEGGYVHALHEGAALAEAQRVIEVRV